DPGDVDKRLLLLVPTADGKRIVGTWAKADLAEQVTLTVVAGSETVTIAGQTSTLTLHKHPGDYPRVDHLIDTFTPADQHAVPQSWGFTGTMLAKFDPRHLPESKHTPLVFDFPAREGKPVRVRLGENFDALV